MPIRPIKNNTIDESKTEDVWQMLQMFMIRDKSFGLSMSQIKDEIKLLKSIGFNPNKHQTDRKLKDLYFKSSQVGRKYRIDRKKKISIILSYQNAINHANIGEE